MTLEVPAWYRDQWATQVIQKFQNRGFVLKGMTEPPVRIEGNKFYFLRTGLLEAQPYARGDDVALLNPEDDTISMESAEWDAAVAIYDFDVTRLPVREVDARQEQCMNALGRRADKITYEQGVLAANVPAGRIIGDYTTGFDPYMALQGCDALQAADAFEAGKIWCGLPERAWNQMLTYKIFSSSDYVGPDLPILRGVEKRTWNMVNWFRLPPHLKAFANAPTNTQLRFRMWNQHAIGAGHNENVRNEWERQATKKRWFVNHTIDGVAKPLLDEGFVEFRILATSPIQSEIQRTVAA